MKKKRNKSFIISIIAVILVSIFLYPVVMKNPHIRNMERLIEDEVEDNEFTLECNSKRGQVIEQISVNGDEESFSEKGVCEKIDKIQKIVYSYIQKNPEGFSFDYRRNKLNNFSLEFDDKKQLDVGVDEEGDYFWRPIFEFYISDKWEVYDSDGFNCVIISPIFSRTYQQKFSELTKFKDVKRLSGYNLEIDKPKLLNNMEGLREIYLAECTGDIEGLKEKAKEMNIECEIEQ